MNNPDKNSEQEALWRVLDEFETPAVSAEFNRELWQRIDATRRAPWYGQLWYAELLHWFKQAIPLAVGAALVVAGFIYDHRAMRTVPAPVSAVELEKAERALDDIQLMGQFERTPEGDPAV